MTTPKPRPSWTRSSARSRRSSSGSTPASIQLTVGDKGSYLYAAFGVPVADEDDAVRALTAADELQIAVDRLGYLAPLQIGITQGRMRTGAYGSATRRTYGVLGETATWPPRLMSAAAPGEILVSQLVRQVAERGTACPASTGSSALQSA